MTTPGPPMLDIENLGRVFSARGRELVAVDGVSLTLREGETIGIVGESGCGKSTLARMILKLLPSSSGSIRLMGEDITKLNERAMRPRRQAMQAVFQDPMSSLNPRMHVRDIIAEPMRQITRDRDRMRRKVEELLDLVGLPANAADRYPHSFSGGQRQRVAIARALACEPKILICDEATSALDVSVQAQILNLVAELQKRLHLSLIFISHNLGAVRHVSQRVAVMYLGRVVEIGPEAPIFERPAHPYTRALIDSVPEPGRLAIDGPPLSGEVPSPLDRPAGCHFHTRCPFATPRCSLEDPPLATLGDGRSVRCFFPLGTP